MSQSIHITQLKSSSKLFGRYITNGDLPGGKFKSGEEIEVYSNYSQRLYIISKDFRVINIKNEYFGKYIFTLQDWRNMKIEKIIKNELF
jgi:hypothetical protein